MEQQISVVVRARVRVEVTGEAPEHQCIVREHVDRLTKAVDALAAQASKDLVEALKRATESAVV